MAKPDVAPPAPRPRLVIADDHHLVVDGMRAALSVHHDVVAVAHTGAEVLRAVAEWTPDVLLLDLSLPDRNGLELLPAIRRRAAATRVVMVTMHLDRALADAALRAGAMGFVPKDAGLAEVETAIAAVLRGDNYISHHVPPRAPRISLAAKYPALAQLTSRQYEILEMIGDGQTSATIAQRLGISPAAVAFHRGNLRRKLGVAHEQGLMRFALLVRGNR